MSVRNAAIIGRSILNGSRSRASLTYGDLREPVGHRDRAQGDEHVVDHGDDRRQPVDQRLEPEPEVDRDDDPARHVAITARLRVSWPRCCRRSRTARRAGSGRCGGPGQLLELGLGDLGLEVGPEDHAYRSRPPRCPGGRLRVHDLEPGVGVVDPGRLEDIPERGGDLGRRLGEVEFQLVLATAGESVAAAASSLASGRPDRGRRGRGDGGGGPTLSSTRWRALPKESRTACLTFSIFCSVVRML